LGKGGGKKEGRKNVGRSQSELGGETQPAEGQKRPGQKIYCKTRYAAMAKAKGERRLLAKGLDA